MSKKFQLETSYVPAGDQPQAIEQLIQGIKDGLMHQTLLGVTGSGKTFTAANIIQEYNNEPCRLIGRLASKKIRRWEGEDQGPIQQPRGNQKIVDNAQYEERWQTSREKLR